MLLHRTPDYNITNMWNLAWVKAFLESIREQAAPTTVYNYYCALASVKKFMQLCGIPQEFSCLLNINNSSVRNIEKPFMQ